MLIVPPIEELRTLCVNLEIISVYDTCCYSVPDMLYMLQNKINEVIVTNNNDKLAMTKALEKIFAYIDDISGNVAIEVRKILMEMLDDGRLADVINNQIFGMINKQIADLTTRIEKAEKEIVRVETELTDKVNEVDERLDSKIDDTNKALKDYVDRADKILQDQIDAIEPGGGGGGGEVDLQPVYDNTNFSTGLQFNSHKSETLGVQIWYATFPKDRTTLKQGFSEYYRNNPLTHTADTSYSGKGENVDNISKYYNSTVCISGSAWHSDGTGFIGTIIDDGVIKCDNRKGWFTCGIDANKNLQFFMPETTASQIKNQGINTAFDCMQPLIKDYKLLPSEWYNKYSGFYSNKAPRTVFGETRNGEWFVMVTHGRTKGHDDGVTYATLTDYLINRFGLKNACCTDGGGSAEMVLHNNKVNWNIDEYGTQRRDLGNALCFSLRPSQQNLQQEYEYESSAIRGYHSERLIDTVSKQGVFYDQVKGAYYPGDDLNEINRSGMYWCHPWTANGPGSISYGIMHFQIDGKNAMQYAYPFADNGYRIMMRRTNSEGTWSGQSWVYPEGNSREVNIY